MLHVTIPEREYFDDLTGEFHTIKQTQLQLEHSLVSLSKWESKWHKPFFSREPRTNEEMLDYVRCMTLTQNVDPAVYQNLPKNVVEEINKYIDDPMTATWINNKHRQGQGSREQVTAELIHYWMITLNIPFECQKWHLNRLLTLVQVCDIKNTPPKKMSKRDLLSRNTALNNARRKQYGTRG